MEDHISSLPDEVICCILSLIPTKSAVKTSILSKRWKYMWTKVPVLDLTEMPHSTTYENLTPELLTYFRSFVSRVLLHNDVSYLRCLRLHLELVLRDDDFYFKSWFRTITRREIREIDISLGRSRRYYARVLLPKRLLSSEGLVVLKLEGNFVFDVLTSLHLPNVEIIHLTHIEFPNDEFMERLSSGCRVLKELHIMSCFGISTLYVASSTLKTLKIIHVMEKYRMPPWCVVIKAPNLTYLSIEGVVTRYDICDLSSLIEADLYFKGREASLIEDNQYMVELVRNVAGVNTLKLKTSALCGRLSDPPIFSNLTSLNLELVDDDGFGILKCAPKLKSLILFNVLCWDYYSFDSESELVCPPMPCLEYVELDWFFGIENEMRVVAYLLKAAPILKEMRIIMDPNLMEFQREIYEGILMFPRSSTACQIEVICNVEDY